MQAAFSAATEAYKFFQGGITAYNLGQKCTTNALQEDCVNEKIACDIAKEVSKLFLSDYGIAITAYATRMPERNLNDLFAFFAIALKMKLSLQKKPIT